MDNMFEHKWVFFYKLVLSYLKFFEKDILAEEDMGEIIQILKSQGFLYKNRPEN